MPYFPPTNATAIIETEIDFGTVGVTDKTFTITDASILSTSKIIVASSGNVAAERASGDSLFDSISYAAVAGSGSFTLYATSSGYIEGKRKIYYTYS